MKKKTESKKIQKSLKNFYLWAIWSEMHFIHSLPEGKLRTRRSRRYESWANNELSNEEYVHLLERGSEDGIGRKARL